MSTEGQIKEILKEHPTMSYNDIARKIGYSKGTVQYYFRKLSIKRDRIARQKINNTDISIAVWFMDDGTRNNCSYYLHTEGFSMEDVKYLQGLLLEKYNILTSIHMFHEKPVIYVRAGSREIFTSLVSPYICKSMRYKLFE